MVSNVDAVIHTSPHSMTMSFDDPAEMLDPALKGVTTLFESVLKYGYDPTDENRFIHC